MINTSHEVQWRENNSLCSRFDRNSLIGTGFDSSDVPTIVKQRGMDAKQYQDLLETLNEMFRKRLEKSSCLWNGGRLLGGLYALSCLFTIAMLVIVTSIIVTSQTDADDSMDGSDEEILSSDDKLLVCLLPSLVVACFVGAGLLGCWYTSRISDFKSTSFAALNKYLKESVNSSWEPRGLSFCIQEREVQILTSRSPFNNNDYNARRGRRGGAVRTRTEYFLRIEAFTAGKPRPPQYAAPVSLPSWWERRKDPDGRIYYFNTMNNATSWQPPSATQKLITNEGITPRFHPAVLSPIEIRSPGEAEEYRSAGESAAPPRGTRDEEHGETSPLV